MKTLTSLLRPHIPKALQADLHKAADTLLAHLDESQRNTLFSTLEASPQLISQLARALLASPFILEQCCRSPDVLLDFLLVEIAAPLSADVITETVRQYCSHDLSREGLDRALRIVRHRLMSAVIWRNVNHLSDFAEVSESMTALAEVCIQQTVDFHHRALSEKCGTPIGADTGLPQPLLVVGMGKLGGRELNVSSDVDLIFVFPESGQTDHATRPLDNQQFFSRLGQRVIKSLNETTVDGLVFRVDMRLRPYGQSGALVSSFTALENYYATQGRDWERFAAIKARVVACSTLPEVSKSLRLQLLAREQLTAILRPFVYRSYTDFSVIESLRKLKALITQEVRRKSMQNNIKLGAGGIRELEFIVQSFQLVRGGREPQLQGQNWLQSLAQLCAEGLFPDTLAEQLRSAYIFLRHTEHILQGYQDQQTQRLPDANSPRTILAWVMKFDDWQHFTDTLNQHRHVANTQFQLVIADAKQERPHSADAAQWQQLWHSCVLLDDKAGTFIDKSAALLSAHGCKQSEDILSRLSHLQNSWGVSQLSTTGRESLDALVPRILAIGLTMEEPDITLQRLLAWLEKIVGRSSYICLLLENPSVLQQLARLFQSSAWIAELLAQMPALLDELLDGQSLHVLPSKSELQNELRIRLLRAEPDDTETWMEVLRYFKLAHSLRVAASDLSGALSLMQVSDYLTWVAEVVIQAVLDIAWQQLTAKHGMPVIDTTPKPSSTSISGFVIVAYGKLGGIEMSYSSDVDLVFIYQAEPQQMTDGAHAIDAQTFYTRLGQKVIHILNTRTLSGSLYDVDMRLRPSGNSGLLASSLQAFSRYQQQDAWTWEHQALVRARAIAGDTELMSSFAQLRQHILTQDRPLPELRTEVMAMREKMRKHLSSSHQRSADPEENHHQTAFFHLKQDAGGIVDIEFMVQYAVLAWASRQPDFAEFTDNIRLLQHLQSSGLSDADQAKQLRDSYRIYREVGHRLALQQQSSLISAQQMETTFAQYRLPQNIQKVRDVWQQWLITDDNHDD